MVTRWDGGLPDPAGDHGSRAWVTTLVVPASPLPAGRREKALTLLVVALIFGIVNAVLKPIIHVVGCVFYLLTLELFALVVNAPLFLLTGWIARESTCRSGERVRLGLPGRHRGGGGQSVISSSARTGSSTLSRSGRLRRQRRPRETAREGSAVRPDM